MPSSPHSPTVVVIMPAYNAGRTLERTYREIPLEWVSECLVVDDYSADATVEVAQRLGLRVFLHKENQGYGGNQKTCYIEALRSGADVIVMLHPDYQYDPKQIPQLIAPILEGRADVVLGSRMAHAISGGMPLYKRIANRFLTRCENKVFGLRLSEYHTGFLALRRQVLEVAPFLLNSNDFIFDQQLVAQAVWFRARFAEIPAAHRYSPEASTIGLRRSIRYGLGVLWLLGEFIVNRAGLIQTRKFRPLHHAYTEITSAAAVQDQVEAGASSDAASPAPTLADGRWSKIRRFARVHAVELTLFLFLWATYAYFYQSTQHNEAARFDQIRALTHDGTLSINKYWWNSADVIHYPKNGTDYIYPNKAPGTTFVGVLPFVVASGLVAPARQFGLPEWLAWHIITYLTTIFSVALLSAFAAVAMYRVLTRIGVSHYFSVFAVLAIWLGTLCFPFSTLFFGHQVAAALLVFAFYLLFTAFELRRDLLLRFGGAGFLMGLAVATEYPAAILVALLCAYATWRIWSESAPDQKLQIFAALAGGLAIGGGMLLVYNLVAFGKPFYIPYEAYAGAKSPFKTYQQGWLGMQLPGWNQLVHALASITVYQQIGILHLRIEDGRLYASNPVLWIALAGLVPMLWRRDRRREGLLVATMTFGFLLFIVSYGKSTYDWGGGGYLGPRHIVPLLPFLTLPMAYGARYLRFLFYPLLAVSVFYMLIATAIEPRVPHVFASPARDFLLPDFLAGNLAQNTDALFDGARNKLTQDSTAFNPAKLLSVPGRYQLAPLMLWWIIAGGALFVLAARRDRPVRRPAFTPDPAGRIRLAADYGFVRRPYSVRAALVALVLFAAVVVIAPVRSHARAERQLKRGDGLLGKYYRSVDWTGDPVRMRVDGKLEFDWSRTMPLQPPFSVEWTGKLVIAKAARYTFAVQADDGALLEINGRPVVDLSRGPAFTKRSGAIELAPGQHKVRVRYFNSFGGGSLKVWWNAPGRPERIVSRNVLIPARPPKH